MNLVGQKQHQTYKKPRVSQTFLANEVDKTMKTLGPTTLDILNALKLTWGPRVPNSQFVTTFQTCRKLFEAH